MAKKFNISSTLFPGFNDVLLPASDIDSKTMSSCDKDGEIRLIAPSEKDLKKMLDASMFWSKDDLWHKCGKVINALKEFQLIWDGNSKDVEQAHAISREVLIKKSAATKAILQKFYALIYLPQNSTSLCRLLISGRVLELARKMVRDGAVSEDYVYDFMKWGDPPKRYTYYYSSHGSQNNKWANSMETSFLSTMCSETFGYKEQKYPGDYLEKTRYFIPRPELIKFILTPLVSNDSFVELPNDEVEVFDGSDFVPLAEMTLGLILSGTVKLNKTKAGQSAIKKISSLVPVAQFPSCYSDFPTRADLIANMAAFAQNDGLLETLGKKCSNSEMLRKMYNVIDLQYTDFDVYLISSIMDGVSKDTYYDNGAAIYNLANTVRDNFSFLPDGKWESYMNFCNKVSLDFANFGHSFVIPTGYRSSTDRIYMFGRNLPISGMKEYFHDYFIEVITLGMAAIGGLELAFDKNGKIGYLRLTEVGKWLTGKIQSFPQIKIKTDGKPDFAADEITGMILVENPESPYIGMLSDFADKITDKRYAISVTKFLSDCASRIALEEKINRFRSFILPDPGKKIEAILEKMLADSNKVKKTPGGSTYQLVDVNTADRNLHSLILNDPETRKNILKVEGCRLLVKTSYIPKFIARLKKEGYITEL